MARPLRVEYAGACYHVMNRGITRENLFHDKRDREKFLEYLAKAAERFSVVVHTYCLMSNHYHLLLETPVLNLSVAIQWLNLSYATYCNKRYRRSGYLFQGRFKALLIDKNEYLTVLSRYIHLNPVRAKIVKNPVDYPWSSYPAYRDRRKGNDWLETGRVLEYFGKQGEEAVAEYTKYVEEVDGESLEDPHKDVVGGFILGGKRFVDLVKDKFLSSVQKEEKEIPQLKKLKQKKPLKAILCAVCEEFGCKEELLREKGRKGNHAREVAIYLARDLGGMSCKDMGMYFGNVSGAAITMKYNKIIKELNRNKDLRGKINRIKKQLLNL